ncbi:MAG: 50S ribosomal protein L24 [Candidatus Levyibacteriota bacterium]
MKLQKGDEIKVVAGKDKGKSGKVEKTFPKIAKVLVNGVNQYKRHMKARQQGQQSEIITLTKPLPVANVQLVCPKCHELTRVGYEMGKEKKVRICRKCGQKL